MKSDDVFQGGGDGGNLVSGDEVGLGNRAGEGVRVST